MKLIWVESNDAELEVSRTEFILLMNSDNAFHTWMIVFVQYA